MTLDDAIKRAEAIAEENFGNAVYIIHKIESDVGLVNALKYKRRAEEYRQLAEWLKELKRLRGGIAETKSCITCTHHKPDNPYCECCFDLDKYEKEVKE